MMKRVLFRYTKDLRVHDHKALIKALTISTEIVPVFFIDQALTDELNGLTSTKAAFLRDALISLDTDLQKLGAHLHIFQGEAMQIIPGLVKNRHISDIIASIQLNSSLSSQAFECKNRCRQNQIGYHNVLDNLLADPQTIKPYKVFSPYFKTRLKQVQSQDQSISSITQNIEKLDLDRQNHEIPIQKLIDTLTGINMYRPIAFAKKRLHDFNFHNYEQTRNNLSEDGVSRLAPYITRGIISIREVYQAAKGSPSYLFELGRREFWQQIGLHFPISKTEAFQENKRNLKRQNNPILFDAFCKGKTGYPIIDAAIKQLLTENWMHNRARMVVASFLTKDLLIDRKWGEKFFRQHLLDYDENSNIGNRQWSASVGADPKPMRIFSPIRQSQRFDPQCEYIFKYLPTLKKHAPKEIHDPLSNILNYHSPIINHHSQVLLAKALYKDH